MVSEMADNGSTQQVEDLTPELSTVEAAEMLRVSKDTVLRLKRAGLLEYRNAAPPTSARPIFRFTLASVKAIRNTYTTDIPPEQQRREERRRKVRVGRRNTDNQARHFVVDDD